MQQLVIPYQKHSNKQILDYLLLCNNQLNNVNCATDLLAEEAKKDNHAYSVLNEGKLYVTVFLSKKDVDKDCYSPLTDIWVELQDVQLQSDNQEDTLYSVYSFDIKKFYSVLSFSSDYKNRKEISLFLTPLQDKMYYKISDNILVDLAFAVKDAKILHNIQNSFSSFMLILQDLKDEVLNPNSILDVDPVDKNSFLLPYANYKDCLNFTVADTNNYLKIFTTENGVNYIECTHINKDDNISEDFNSSVILRKDKFFKKDSLNTYMSPGVWQILVILQSMKSWLSFSVNDSGYAVLSILPEVDIYHVFYDDDCLRDNAITKSATLDNFLVGKLYANEIFTLNKLFTNMKTSYFDFSLQKFVGTNYVFSDNKEDVKEVKLLYTCENNNLPLKLTFTELKHYIGGDLSQKDFILHIFFDGTNVTIQRWNNAETTLEYSIKFNQAMSRKYLSL